MRHGRPQFRAVFSPLRAVYAKTETLHLQAKYGFLSPPRVVSNPDGSVKNRGNLQEFCLWAARAPRLRHSLAVIRHMRRKKTVSKTTRFAASVLRLRRQR